MEVVSIISEKIIGSEELNPILTYCVIKAKPLNWVSSLEFMNLMIDDKDLKGEKGFALTKLKLATEIIETANRKYFKGSNFLMKLLKNEV